MWKTGWRTRTVHDTYIYYVDGPTQNLSTKVTLIQVILFDVVGENEVTLDSGDTVTTDQLSSELDAAISLPASLFERIDDRDSIGIFVTLYNTPILFPVGRKYSALNSLKQRIVGSQVLAATVGPGINFQNLDEPVTILLQLQVAKGMVSS